MSLDLRQKTRQPEFIWRLVLGILAVGAAVAFVVQAPPEEPPARPLSKTSYERYSQHIDSLQRFADNREWGPLWWGIPRGRWLGLVPGAAGLALLTGGCWFAVVVQAGQPHRSGGIRWPLAVAALVLGVLSVWPTLFAIYWQEEMWGLDKSQDLADGLRFYILGVGLREELCKLLLFLPLVPWVIRRRSQREALLLAACVGLGFALEENSGYFIGEADSSSGRFLTANFMHMSLTGLVGLALCRGIWQPREYGAQAAATLLAAVFVHGLYDALIVLPALEGYSIFGSILFILLAYQFFSELRYWWEPPGETISLTATFLTSVALIVATTLVYLSSQIGFQNAIQAAAVPAVGLGVMVYMFLREMPESIINV